MTEKTNDDFLDDLIDEEDISATVDEEVKKRGNKSHKTTVKATKPL